MWEEIRELAPSLPTGKKKVSDIVVRLLSLGLETYGVTSIANSREQEMIAEKAEKSPKAGDAYEVEVEGVKLFLKPVG